MDLRFAIPLRATQRAYVTWARRASSVALVAVAMSAAHAASTDGWPMFGKTLANTAATTTSVGDPSQLKPKWTFTAGGEISARAAIVGGVAYVPD